EALAAGVHRGRLWQARRVRPSAAGHYSPSQREPGARAERAATSADRQQLIRVMPAKRLSVLSTTHREAPDVVVVGARLPSLAVAWRARARGLQALVVDRDVPGAGASGVA